MTCSRKWSHHLWEAKPSHSGTDSEADSVTDSGSVAAAVSVAATLTRLRKEQKFDRLSALVAQIEVDAKRARELASAYAEAALGALR